MLHLSVPLAKFTRSSSARTPPLRPCTQQAQLFTLPASCSAVCDDVPRSDLVLPCHTIYLATLLQAGLVTALIGVIFSLQACKPASHVAPRGKCSRSGWEVFGCLSNHHRVSDILGSIIQIYYRIIHSTMMAAAQGSIPDPRTRRSRGLKSSIPDLLHDLLLVSNGYLTVSLSIFTILFSI